MNYGKLTEQEVERLEQTKNGILYAYIKGDRYSEYRVYMEENDNLKEVEQEFDTFEELIEFAVNFSHFYSVAIQFYR